MQRHLQKHFINQVMNEYIKAFVDATLPCKRLTFENLFDCVVYGGEHLLVGEYSCRSSLNNHTNNFQNFLVYPTRKHNN